MRLRCEYRTEEIPQGYHMMFVSLIKEALNQVDKEYCENLYTYDGNKANKRSKDFTFAVFMNDFELEEEMFLINDRVVLNLSTPDYEFGIKLYNGLLKLKDFKYKDFSLNQLRIDMLKEAEVGNSPVKFTTLSPICIKDEENTFLDIDDKNYEKELNYIVDKVLENYRGYGLQQKLSFTPMGSFEKVVVKQKIAEFTEKTGRPYYYVNSYQGEFKLEGNKEDLQDIYQLGVGFKRNQGFGMVEVS